jgi:hypothetical protein
MNDLQVRSNVLLKDTLSSVRQRDDAVRSVGMGGG